MRVLLPPSEAKVPGGRGRPIGRRPVHGALEPARREVLTALGTLLRGDPVAAAEALHLPPRTVDHALAANRAVSTAPTTAALRRYAGVLYDGLALGEMPADARRVAGRCALVFSGLWGVLRGDEAVPDYRVPATAVLPGIGTVGRHWRGVLDTHLVATLGRGVVVDLRSSDYAAMWRPHGAIADRVVTVRVLSPLPHGGEGVVSHPSKRAKGRLAAALFARVAMGLRVESADDIVVTWRGMGGGAEVDRTGTVVIHTA